MKIWSRAKLSSARPVLVDQNWSGWTFIDIQNWSGLVQVILKLPNQTSGLVQLRALGCCYNIIVHQTISNQLSLATTSLDEACPDEACADYIAGELNSSFGIDQLFMQFLQMVHLLKMKGSHSSTVEPPLSGPLLSEHLGCLDSPNWSCG